jgi:hypothetical protein
MDTDSSRHLFEDEMTIRVLDVPLYHSRPRDSRPEVIASTGKVRLKLISGVGYHIMLLSLQHKTHMNEN